VSEIPAQGRNDMHFSIVLLANAGISIIVLPGCVGDSCVRRNDMHFFHCFARESGHLVFVVPGCVGDSASPCGMTGFVVWLCFSWGGCTSVHGVRQAHPPC